MGEISKIYSDLIQEILSLPVEESQKILTSNRNLLDVNFAKAILEYMSKLTDDKGSDSFDILLKIYRSIESQLMNKAFSKMIGFSVDQDDPILREFPEKYVIFLEQLMQTILINSKNLKAASNVVRENLNLCDKFFLDLLSDWLPSKFNTLVPGIAEEFADCINAFGNLMQGFPLGNRSINLEIAIVCYSSVSDFFNDEINDLGAGALINLGVAYIYRIYGEKGRNLEIAIQYLSSALKFFNRDNYPTEWAAIQSNLGIAYKTRIYGETAKNLESAILCYLCSLEVYNQLDFIEDCARVQNNLGEAYRLRIRARFSQNIKQAIACYLSALKFYKSEDHPDKWAAIQTNLGIAYGEIGRKLNPDYFNLAIKCYLSALQIFTIEEFPWEWASIHNNMGNTYVDYIGDNRQQTLEMAIQHYVYSLQVRTYNMFPELWASTQHNLGVAYRKRILGEKIDNLRLSTQCYLRALKVRTKICFPKDYANTMASLGVVYQEMGDFEKAYITIGDAIRVSEAYRDEIVFGSDYQEDKQKIAEYWNRAYQRMIEICVKLTKYTETIEYAERSKTRNLVELILTRDRHTIFPAEVVTQLDRLRDEIASGQYEIQNATAEDPAALAQHLQQLRQQRNELQDQYLPIGSGFQFDPFRATLSDRTAIVEFYITADKLLVFIITKHTQQPIVLSPDLINMKKLANWTNSYLKAYSYKKSHWQRRLTTRLNLLAKILHIDEIIEQIPTECDKLILITHRYLHLLPLHGLPLAGDSSLFDRFPGGVSYAPSCQLLQLAQNRQRPEFTRLFAVQNPTGDLSYTDLEVETIQSYFNTSNLLKQKIATKEAIDNTFLTAVHCAHFSCHGYFNGIEPRKSALLLADSQLNSAPTQPDAENYLILENGGVLDLNKCLTLDSVFTLNLEQCRLVTLSACETGLIDFRNTSDEYIGLPSGFLYAGASSVVSSLWTVNDLSTAFLMIRFYQNLQNGLAVGLALNQAQLWLKNSSKGDLEIWIEENQLPLKPAVRMSFLRRFNKLDDDDKPFKSPFYWAAFCAIGN